MTKASVPSQFPHSSVHPTAVIETGVDLGAGCIIHPFTVIATGSVLGDGVEVFPFSYVGKVPKGAGALAHEPEFESTVRIGANCSIGPGAIIYYDVEIGRNCLVGDNASIRERCRIGDRIVISRCVTVNFGTTIGDDTKVMDNTHLTGTMKIGKRVFIAPGVTTANDNAIGKDGYDEERITGAVIEDDVAIGLGVSILPALTIGRGAIVGAKALVTRDVAPGETVMGVPARPRQP